MNMKILVIVAGTYLAEARGELFVHVLHRPENWILANRCWNDTAHVLSARKKLTKARDFGFLPETEEGKKELTFCFKAVVVLPNCSNSVNEANSSCPWCQWHRSAQVCHVSGYSSPSKLSGVGAGRPSICIMRLRLTYSWSPSGDCPLRF